MDTTHRKIELQSPADLTYLRNNATRCAREKLDLHFPPSAAPSDGSSDPMKKRVEELVDQYLERIFTNAYGNLEVNGLGGEEAMKAAEEKGEELEAYDTRLAGRILKTSAQVEALTLQLASLRRTAPEVAARAYGERWGREQELFREKRRLEEERLVREAEGVRTGVEGVERWGEMGERWEEALATLGGVKEGIGGTVARLGQARDAAEVLDGK